MESSFLDAYRDDLRVGLTHALHGDDQVHHLLRYHVGLETQRGKPADLLGSLLQPSLLLFVAEDLGAHIASALPAAIALELLHGFSRLRNDIKLGETTLADRPTLQSLAGVAAAVHAGDQLLTSAFLESTRSSAAIVECLLEGTRDLLDGQALELEFETRWITRAEYRAMIMLKTAALFRVTFELSGLIAEASPETVKRLASFGEEVGIAYQVRTDILDVWGVEDSLGDPKHVKPRFRKTMYPLIAAHEDGTDKDRQFLEGTFHGMLPMDGNIEKILALLDRLAIRAASEDQMKAHLQEAAKHVPYIPFSESALQALTDWFDDLTAFTRPLSS